jgi:hypothetical protein
METQFSQDGPIQYEYLQRYTRSDPVLQQVIRFVQRGWPKKIEDPMIKPFVACQQQFSIRDGCLLKHPD